MERATLKVPGMVVLVVLTDGRGVLVCNACHVGDAFLATVVLDEY